MNGALRRGRSQAHPRSPWAALGGAAAALAASAVLAAAGPALSDADVDARYQRLAMELRCLVCQNQSLADSNAALALDLKTQVREQLRAGRSDREVIDYMTQRYGDFVLYRPPLKATTLLLWGGPALMLLAGALLLWRSLASVRPEPGPPDADGAVRAVGPFAALASDAAPTQPGGPAN